jgi:pyrimidine-nucleoside phosphorylase
MLVIPLIERKRDGGELTATEWSQLIAEYAAGRVPDYQMSALLMASYLNGLSNHELAAVTDAMAGSGVRFEFGADFGPRVDKHSTGGVGDKVSIVLAPLVASCGVAVPMMSGRGLGHTGGTLDKLESIPGFRTDISVDEAMRQVERIGCAMIGQTEEIAPADRRLYALRDATATVESIPLMAASIMSKKLAEDLTGLVLDIKRGSGALLPHVEAGMRLARTMVELGEERGCQTVALVTAMDRPLGHACGNALELEEAVAALKGAGPPDLMEVVYTLGVEMLLLAGLEGDPDTARRCLERGVESGAGVEKLAEVVESQGGDPGVLDTSEPIARAPIVESYRAPDSGTVQQVDPRPIGRAVVELGGGRRNKEDTIDDSVGFVITVKPGDEVESGDEMAEVHAADGAGVAKGIAALEESIVIGDGAIQGLPLVSHRVTAQGVEELT